MIGALLVIGCSITLGLGYIMDLRRRFRVLKEFIDALPVLRREICDFLTPTQEAIELSGARFDTVRELPEVSQLERVLGRYGAEEQRIAITRTEARLTAALECLDAERKSKGRVFAATCISAGLMAAIILI
jgi:hypothetical protein